MPVRRRKTKTTKQRKSYTRTFKNVSSLIIKSTPRTKTAYIRVRLTEPKTKTTSTKSGSKTKRKKR